VFGSIFCQRGQVVSGLDVGEVEQAACQLDDITSGAATGKEQYPRFFEGVTTKARGLWPPCRGQGPIQRSALFVRVSRRPLSPSSRSMLTWRLRGRKSSCDEVTILGARRWKRPASPLESAGPGLGAEADPGRFPGAGC